MRTGRLIGCGEHGFKALVPLVLDIERHCINMGSHHVGAYMPSQLGGNRPTPDLGRYSTPLKGLYLCGASSHTGGLSPAARATMPPT